MEFKYPDSLRICKWCEWNFGGICAGSCYGINIKDDDKGSGWEVGLQLWLKIGDDLKKIKKLLDDKQVKYKDIH